MGVVPHTNRTPFTLTGTGLPLYTFRKMAAVAPTVPPPLEKRRFRDILVWPAAGLLLFAAVYGAALAFRAFSLSSGSTLGPLGAHLLNLETRNIAETIAAGLCLAAAWLVPKGKWTWLHGIEQRIATFAHHRIRAIAIAGLLPVIIRLALLPALPVPQPAVHDEFGYLLLADTFASGRVTNPTHPFWRHFEAPYIFFQPTYTSQYPVAPAILLALPKVFGAHPWLGVCLGTGLLCALVCWMLQGWVPPPWALLGGLLAASRYGIVSSWVNTYWGGTAAAIGGALVVGSLPRLLRAWRTRDSLLLALGLAILAQSRPYEGFLFSLPVLILLLARFLKDRRMALRERLAHSAVPFALAMAAVAGWMAYYNWRVTGHPLVMPYMLNQELYGTPQSFFWQRPLLDAPGIHRHKDIADVFAWQMKAYRDGFTWKNQGERLASFWEFYLQPLLTLPLLWLPWGLRKPRIRVLVLGAGLLLIGNSLYPFFFPHYAAPLCGVLLLLVVQGMRHLRAQSAFAFHALLFLILTGSVLTAAGGIFDPALIDNAETARSKAARQLVAHGGKHLVLVTYSSDHSFHNGVIYNDADIDHSSIVWARSLDPAANRALLSYYHDRQAWIFHPDETPVTLVPFTEEPYVTVVAGGAGKPEDGREGVSPGEIAIILGGNFAREPSTPPNPAILGDLPLQLAAATPQFGDVFAAVAGPRLPARPSPFPMRMGDLSVQFGGHVAPILAVSRFGSQEAVTVQVPFDLSTGWCSVTLRVGAEQATQKVRVRPVSPGILQMRMSDSVPRGILIRPDGTLVDLEHPARRGETLKLLATGLGSMYPPVPTNQPGPTPALSEPIYRLVLGINQHAVPLLTAHYAVGLVGLEEIAFRVPDSTPAGKNIPLVLGAVSGAGTLYSNSSLFPVAP